MRESSQMRPILALGVLAALLLSPAPASAHRRNFALTYDWFTPLKNEKEVEFRWTQERAGDADASAEFEYGVTGRYVFAPYLLLSRGHGDAWEVEGWKLEQRYRFGDFHEKRLLPAAYLEVEREGGDWSMEGKFITSCVWGPHIWSFNLIAEQPIEAGAPLAWGYSTGVARLLKGSLFGRATWIGAELYGNLFDRTHFAGPAVGHSFNRNAHVMLTGAMGLNRRSDTQVSLLFEYEWR